MRNLHPVKAATVLLLCAGLCLAHCGGSGPGGPADLAAADDARLHDLGGEGDTRTAAEAGVTDDGAPEIAPEVHRTACETPPQGTLLPPDSGAVKFALSLYHYNVQYVAGGLKGFDLLGKDRPELDLDDGQVQDRIIVESLVPLLDALVEHPSWGVDVELQGYMLEIMAERHPDELEKMRQLVALGQLHVDSFHWSDQLWTAFPAPSMERSLAFNERAFQASCLPLGKAVFSQEGQFGHGMATLIRASQRVALLPTNFHKYHYGNQPGHLAYDWEGTTVLVAGKGVVEEVGGEQVEVKWHFMNDGELAFTGGANPYFGTLFAYDPVSSAKYIEDLEQLEAEGWRIATIADYLANLDQRGYQPEPLPLILDGTWQPKDTQNVFRWMGGMGAFEEEDDNGVLSGNVRSRLALQASRALLASAEPAVRAALEEDLTLGWGHQLLAEVSDSTGWNPWAGEVAYSRDHSRAAMEQAWEVAKSGLDALESSGRAVDTAGGASPAEVPDVAYRFSGPESLELEVACTESEAPVEVEVEAPGWTVEAGWCRLQEGCFMLNLELTPGGAAGRRIEVVFPRWGDTLAYVPALLEETGTVTLFQVNELVLDDTQTLTLGLANGLLGLGEDKWLVKAAARVHLAALVPKEEEVVRFENQTQPPDKSATYTFFFLEGVEPAAAAAFAARLNVTPVVLVGE